MKRMYLVIVAAVMAISFSAFTTKSVDPPYKYKNDLNQLVEVPASISVPSECPAGTFRDCQIMIDDELETIYHSNGAVYRRTQ